ncbi:MAG: 23S rRNA (pseudouridine(1915)-N(3))-methyltransferase RlmH [Lachnospiraceae bacterium]|nr:23S rRNA (pseudouridine(1915)-N(3))-methyltransferase RlmH [Candidatus Colinaster equi]
MKISIICVGKIKEKFYSEALAEYAKRLSKYCKLDIIELADEKTPEKASAHECELITKAEGDRILAKIASDAYVIATAIEGGKLDSVSFSKCIQKITLDGKNHIAFIIGGSLGLHPDVKKRADMLLSFSDMTFPHQLMRVILLEQIYRCFRIMNNEPYHK